MRRFNQIIRAFSLLAAGFSLLAHAANAQAQPRSFRGSISDVQIEMRLNVTGQKVTGTYRYDHIGKDIKLNGQFDNQGRLQLFELSPANKRTAKITCKRSLEDLVDSECWWSRLDGKDERTVDLYEQHVALTDGMRVIPKRIRNQKLGLNISYPQLVNDAKPLSPGAQGFNRAALASVRKVISEFAPEDAEEEIGGVFNVNYILLFAANDLISVEFAEDDYVRGTPHPNEQYWTITYDLKENRELELKDLFKPGSDFKPAIAKAAGAYIDAKSDAMEKQEAEREGRKPELGERGPYMDEEIAEPDFWAITPKGLMIYFNFPHVKAFFDRVFVPYKAIKEHLKPDGPVARFQ